MLGRISAHRVFTRPICVIIVYSGSATLSIGTMKETMKAMLETPALRHPFRVCLPDGTQDFRLRSLTMETSYPWPRTFEIYLENTPFLEKVSH